MKRILKLIGVFFVVLFIYAAWVKYRSLDYNDGGPPLAIRWEGFYHDMNFRDVGKSINQCLGSNALREGVLLRAAGWFSGWSCDKVGNPDVIYSLNYSPAKEERYFCHEEEGKNIGRYFNPTVKLNDLEFLDNWEDRETRQATCRFLKDIFVSILEEKKVLLHCDAGRDRTGTISALLAGLALESENTLDSNELQAIECDYRKTESLVEEKYGRMEAFLHEIVRKSSVQQFIADQCGVQKEVVQLVAKNLRI